MPDNIISGYEVPEGKTLQQVLDRVNEVGNAKLDYELMTFYDDAGNVIEKPPVEPETVVDADGVEWEISETEVTAGELYDQDLVDRIAEGEDTIPKPPAVNAADFIPKPAPGMRFVFNRDDKGNIISIDQVPIKE